MKTTKQTWEIGAAVALALTLVGAAVAVTNRARLAQYRHPPHQDRRLHLIVRGRVVDSNGHPVLGAAVYAALGLDLDDSPALTDTGGHFTVEASARDWFKGDPLVTATADGYDGQWLYFPRWNQGEQSFERTIVVKAHANRAARTELPSLPSTSETTHP